MLSLVTRVLQITAYTLYIPVWAKDISSAAALTLHKRGAQN